MAPLISMSPGPEELEKAREVLNLLSEGRVNTTALEAKLDQEDDPMRTREVLEMAEEYAKSAPYVNHEQDLYRRVRVLEADQKSDPNVVENVRRNRELIEKLVVAVDLRTMKLRLIMVQYEKERAAVAKEEEEAEQRRLLQDMGIQV